MRTIESIIDNHHAAQARLEAGTPVWGRTLRIKHLLGAGTATEVGAAIASTLRSSGWMKASSAEAEETGGDPEVEWLAEDFASEATDTTELDRLLDQLYDLADADRVWVR